MPESGRQHFALSNELDELTEDLLTAVGVYIRHPVMLDTLFFCDSF